MNHDENLSSKIETYPIIEEKVGLSLNNLSVITHKSMFKDEYMIKILGDVILKDYSKLENSWSITIKATIYEDDYILGVKRTTIRTANYIGIETFKIKFILENYNSISKIRLIVYLDKPISAFSRS